MVVEELEEEISTWLPLTPDMKAMRNINDIAEGDKLFYELGFKLNIKLGVTGGNWIRTGKFKEVKDVKDMLVNDKRMVDIDYLEHHNFMLIKN